MERSKRLVFLAKQAAQAKASDLKFINDENLYQKGKEIEGEKQSPSVSRSHNILKLTSSNFEDDILNTVMENYEKNMMKKNEAIFVSPVPGRITSVEDEYQSSVKTYTQLESLLVTDISSDVVEIHKAQEKVTNIDIIQENYIIEDNQEIMPPVHSCISPINDEENSGCKTDAQMESVSTTGLSSGSMNIQHTRENDVGETEISVVTPERANMSKRWKKADESTWKRNVEKKKRKMGVAYVSSKGKKQLPKIPKPIDCSNCRYKCTTKFSEDERKALCNKYRNLPFERQKDFILLNVDTNVPKRRRQRNAEGSGIRSESRKYNFIDNSGVKVQVCQSFFLKTLCISNHPVINAFKNVSSSGQYEGKDKRGQNTSGNKTSNSMVDIVMEHINSFSVMESHYTRKSTKRQYLQPNLSISKMYSLYKEKCSQDNQECVSEITYRRIFCTKFNLSFFTPKKDQCMVCNHYEKASPEEKTKIGDSYREHIERKTQSMLEKERDKKRARDDKEFKSITCDLQSVFQIPSSSVSLMYYMRKINLYNFTIYEASPPNGAYCYFWTELNGKRGSSEIGTCLCSSFYLKSLSADVKHLTIFSDTCGGQNRNIQIAILLLHTVVTHPTLNTIEQKFLESGHSFMEVDSMHSAIEKAKKHVDIFSVHEMQNIFKSARTAAKGKPPYNTQELLFSDFLDLKKFVQNTTTNRRNDDDGNDVNWLKIKCLRYEKSLPDTIQYKYGYGEDFKRICINSKRRKRSQHMTLRETSIMPLYDRNIPISVQKKNDLLKLCRQNIIPQELQPWYQNLPTSSSARDTVMENDVSEDDDI